MKKLNEFFRTLKLVLANVRGIFVIVWREDPVITGGFFTSFGIIALFPLITNYILKLFIDELVSAQGIVPNIPTILIFLLGARYLVSLLSDFINYGLRGTYFDYLFRYRTQNVISYKFYEKLSTLDLQYFEDPKTQDLIAKAEDIMLWRPNNFIRDFASLFANVVGYLSVFVVLLPYSLTAPLVVSLSIVPRAILRTRYGKVMWSIYSDEVPESRKLWYLGRLLTQRTSLFESRIFQNSAELLRRLKRIQNELYIKYHKPVKNFLKLVFYPQVFELAVVAFFAYLRLPEVLNGSMTVGDYIFFVNILSNLSTQAMDMIFNLGDLYETNLYVSNYFEVLKLEKIVKEPVNPKALPLKFKPPRIEFKNVSFSYPGAKRQALKNISFTILPAENVALVGPNGAGKTTIVKLLCRFYDVTQGEILINEVNIKDINLSDWYKQLGTLFQEFVKYDFTVRENIMLGNPAAEDEERMKKAAKASGAADFIEELPRRYNQLLGRQFEGGIEVSVGQWQKLAIARAFYEGAPLLILDEPTSAIDAEAEYEIFKNLKEFYKDKSLLLISHRFSTVRNANKILVLEEGKITEEGSHTELLKKGGKYARMFKKQALGYK